MGGKVCLSDIAGFQDPVEFTVPLITDLKNQERNYNLAFLTYPLKILSLSCFLHFLHASRSWNSERQSLPHRW